MTRSTRPRGRARIVAVLAVGAVLVAACGGDGDDAAAGAGSATTEGGADTDTATDNAGDVDVEPVVTDAPATDAPATTPSGGDDDPGGDGVREVPGEYDTIQAAVEAAVEGDIVLIAPGTYHEAVDVLTPNLTIRGLDRDGVVLDGQLELDNGIRVLGANGVAVENLTATNYTSNGVFFTSVQGYRASYISTYRTGDYGIYAFDSVGGLIEHAHTIGSKDAGVYIGQCYPCDAVITDVVSEHNGLGYSGTNSGGNLLIVDSVFRNNRAGIVPNSGSYELCYPERETTIVGNLVHSNNQADTPAIDVALLAQGNGILVAGGIRNVISKNRVFDHNRTGIGLVPFLEEDANDDLPTEDEWDTPCADQKNELPVVPDGALLWDSFENEVTLNVVSDSREADLALASAGTDISTLRNCFSGNEFGTTAPLALEDLAPCEGAGSAGDWTAGDLGVARWIGEQASLPGEVDWKVAPLPELGEHDDLPDAATAPARPATDVPPSIDLDAITVPDAPA
jgi:hypothetical protein